MQEGEIDVHLSGLDCILSKKGEGLGALTGVKKRFFSLAQGSRSHVLKINYYEKQGGIQKGTVILSHTSVVDVHGPQISIVCLHICTRKLIYIYIYEFVCIHEYVYMYVCMYGRMEGWMDVCMYVDDEDNLPWDTSERTDSFCLLHGPG